MIRTIKLLLLMFLVNVLFSAQARAQTINAASCSQVDVMNALGSVAADGTTVVIPAGTCTWTTASSQTHGAASIATWGTVSYVQVYSTTIIGATTCPGLPTPSSCTDGTTIIDNTNHNAGGDSGALSIQTASGKSFRLSGLTFSYNASSILTYHGVLGVAGSSQAVRIDHCHFNKINNVSAGTNGQEYGVWDHNVIDAAAGNSNAIQQHADNWGGASNGDGSWADKSTFGSNRFMFVENNTFNGGFMNDCTQGGRFVFRYNVLNVGGFTNGGIQTHPTGGSGRIRGCRAWEIYKNTFNGGSSTIFNVYFLSSGTGLIWGNSATSGFQYFISLHSVRRDTSDYGIQPATPNGWGMCGTSANGTGSAWDQNAVASTGYRCLDQPGQGVGDLLSGAFPSAVNTTTGTIAWPHQALEPVYEWFDRWNASGSPSTFINNYESDAMFQNEDYYICTTPGAGTCTGFTGTSGVGAGLLSARPSTCTAGPGGNTNGVAYWATDTNTLYVCNPTNTWTTYYTPYTYPHPLVAGSGVTGNPPLSPTNLMASVQ